MTKIFSSGMQNIPISNNGEMNSDIVSEKSLSTQKNTRPDVYETKPQVTKNQNEIISTSIIEIEKLILDLDSDKSAKRQSSLTRIKELTGSVINSGGLVKVKDVVLKTLEQPSISKEQKQSLKKILELIYNAEINLLSAKHKSPRFQELRSDSGKYIGHGISGLIKNEESIIDSLVELKNDYNKYIPETNAIVLELYFHDSVSKEIKENLKPRFQEIERNLKRFLYPKNIAPANNPYLNGENYVSVEAIRYASKTNDKELKDTICSNIEMSSEEFYWFLENEDMEIICERLADSQCTDETLRKLAKKYNKEEQILVSISSHFNCSSAFLTELFGQYGENKSILESIVSNENSSTELLSDIEKRYKTDESIMQSILIHNNCSPDLLFEYARKEEQSLDIIEAIALNDKCPLELLFELARSEEQYLSVILHIASNKNSSLELLTELAGEEDPNRDVLQRILNNPNCSYELRQELLKKI